MKVGYTAPSVEGQAGGDRRGPLGGRDRRRDHRLHRGARHRHRRSAIRSRSQALRQGVPRLHPEAGLRRPRHGEGQHRPPRHRRRHRRADQDRARAAARRDPAQPATSSGRTRASTSPPARSTSTASSREWKRDGAPRRAGVSSFGFGGTNAHVMGRWRRRRRLPERPAAAGPWRLLAVSAKTPAALAAAVRNLAEHFRDHPETDLGDAAFTLIAGRQAFAHRVAVVCRDAASAVAALDRPIRPRTLAGAEARLAAAGRRWLAGEPLDPEALFAGEERRRIPLPTYPFERHRYWIEPSGIEPGGIRRAGRRGGPGEGAGPPCPARAGHRLRGAARRAGGAGRRGLAAGAGDGPRWGRTTASWSSAATRCWPPG